jgi:hypothetical protein
MAESDAVVDVHLVLSDAVARDASGRRTSRG